MAIKPIEILIRAKDDASGILGSIQTKLLGLAAVVAGFFGISLFAGAVRSAADFEAALSRVKAAAGATDEEFKALKQAAEDAGSSTKYTSVQAAQALENLAKAGLNAKDSIATLPAVLSLAQAGDIELGQSAEFVTKAIMGMGLQFSDAARVADVLAMGANASNTSVTGLAQALSYAAPTAKTLGMSLELTVAIIGKFADAGIDASRAGTALNAIMGQFSDPSSKFRQELGAAGITTGNFEQALRELAKAGPSGAKAINAVGLEAGPALKALLGQGIGALDELKGKLDESAGSAAKMALVMEGNLQGSMRGLGSAWDTVKNVLGAPVLPVLKDGVDQLAGALRGLVTDGTIAKFGESMAEAFRSAIKWGREFIAQIDFKAITASLQDFAERSGEAFAKIGEYATNTGNTVKTVYGVMSAGVNAVLTVVYGLGVAFAGVAAGIQNGLALLYEGIAKITPGIISAKYKEVAAELRLSAEATTAASRALADKTIESFTDMGDGAQLARDGVSGLIGVMNATKPAADTSAQAISGVAQKLQDIAEKNATARKATEDKKAADEAATIAIGELRGEYAALISKGDLQGAAEKIQEINKALQGTPTAAKDAAKAAEEAAKKTDDAFAGLGITSQATLKQAAESARVYFLQIKSDANSTAVDTENAFKVYAEKSIAANNGVATEALKVEAAMRGVAIQTDGTGKAVVNSMVEGAAAVKTVEDAYRQLGLKTPEELNKIAAANEAAWSKIKGDSSASMETLKSAFAAYAQSAIAASGNVGSAQRITTEEILKTEAAAKGLSITFDANGRMVVQTQAEAAAAIARTTGALGGQRDAVDSVTSALERQNAAQERANAAIEKAAELERKRQNVDKEGFMLNTAGERVSINKPTQRSVYENAKGQGLTEAQSLQISNQFIQNGQQAGYGGANAMAGENWGTELQKSIDKLVLANASTKGDTDKTFTYEDGSVSPDPDGSLRRNSEQNGHPWADTPGDYARFVAEATPSKAVTAATTTVNINLSINNSPIGIVDTSPSGATVIQNFMSELQQAKRSSGLAR
ncbi:MAG: phage tail tape measure protein [Rhodoferax sp.]